MNQENKICKRPYEKGLDQIRSRHGNSENIVFGSYLYLKRLDLDELYGYPENDTDGRVRPLLFHRKGQ